MAHSNRLLYFFVIKTYLLIERDEVKREIEMYASHNSAASQEKCHAKA